MPLGEVIGEFIAQVFVEGLFHGFIKRVFFPMLHLPGLLLAWPFERNPISRRVLASKGTTLSLLLSVLFYAGMIIVLLLS